jgi:hypothetical protein
MPDTVLAFSESETLPEGPSGFDWTEEPGINPSASLREPGDFWESRFEELPIQVQSRGITQQNKKPNQSQFWESQTIFKYSVAAKLKALGRQDLADPILNCHTTFTVGVCNACGKTSKFPNRCDRFYCPECQPRRAREKRESVEWWAKLIEQPKHVVLTVKNVPDISSGHVKQLKKWFTALRRSKFARNWKGGFYAIEVTNEGRGWHLHIHALVDARYIDARMLSEVWERVTGHFGRIVKITDGRNRSYLGELLKYGVKGSDLAGWSGTNIADFIDAFTGVRLFGVFGSLYGARTKWADFIATLSRTKARCPCGACDMSYHDESFLLRLELAQAHIPTIRPPPLPETMEFTAVGFAPIYRH